MIDDSHQGDKPLAFHWRALDERWIDALDLPPARNRAYARARASIVLEALITARVQPREWISYSRRKEWYSSGRRYRRTDYSFSTVPDVVDELECLRWLEHDRAPRGRLGRQSRFRAAPALVATVTIPAVLYDPGETIRLKDENDDLIDYRETDATLRMRRRLTRINEALRATPIGLVGAEGPIAIVDGRPIHLGQDRLHRVFNRGSFGLGGRMYGPFWQNLPKAVRGDLLIDGEPTSEGDYPRLHPTLLYAEAGAAPEGDAYALDGRERGLVKRVFDIAVNADTERAAVRAIALEIGGEGAHAKARELLEAIEARHRPIDGCFGSGAGLRLQRRDADLAECVILRLLDRGVVVLPVHDSFVVQTRHGPVRDEIMDDELRKLLAKLAATARAVVASDTYAESGPHNGGGGGSPPSAASLSSPAPPLPPLLVLVGERAFVSGGLAPFAVPMADFSAWGGGVAPAPVRLALRYGIAARGLTQGRLAREVGLSRPQLTNVLAGRRGTSPDAAVRLKAFLLA